MSHNFCKHWRRALSEVLVWTFLKKNPCGVIIRSAEWIM